jgi:RNA polymerase sigma factor for flagellar operon FliA
MSTAEDVYRTEALKQQRDRLVLEHLDYVRHILGRLVIRLPDYVDRENLESAGILGLVEAAHQYDSSRNVAFKTFAFPRIRGAILDELRRNSPLPQKMLQQVAKVRRVCETLPPPVTPEVIAQEAQMTVEDVESTLEAMRMSQVQTWDDSAHLLGGVTDNRAKPPDHSVEHDETKRVLVDAIEALPDKERCVVTLYHLENLRLKEIGKVLHLSESRVSRLLSKAEYLLGQAMKASLNR